MKKKIHPMWNRKGPPDCALGVYCIDTQGKDLHPKYRAK